MCVAGLRLPRMLAVELRRAGRALEGVAGASVGDTLISALGVGAVPADSHRPTTRFRQRNQLLGIVGHVSIARPLCTVVPGLKTRRSSCALRDFWSAGRKRLDKSSPTRGYISAKDGWAHRGLS